MTSIGRRRLALAAGLAPLTALLPGCAHSIGATATHGAPLTHPLALLRTGDIGGLPTVMLTAGERTGRWLVDTGATVHVVAPAAAASIGVADAGRSDVATIAGTTAMRRVRLPPLRAGEQVWHDGEAVVAPLEAYFAPTGEALDGILGLAAMRDRACTIDFAAGAFVMRDRAPDPQATGAAASLPLEIDGGLPVVRLRLGDREPERFLIDTGFAGALVIYARRATRLLESASTAAPPRLTVRELAGEVTAGFASMRSVRLGDVRLADVPVALESGAAARRGGHFDRLSGAIGAALFEHGSLHLDLPRRRLEAAWPRGVPHLPGGWGFSLRAATVPQGGMDIGAVFAEGPAGRAGVEPGDAVVRLNGRSAAGLTPSAAWAALRADAEVVLDLSRAGRHRTVRLRRERFFPPLA